MTITRTGLPRDEQFYWWGPAWTKRHPQTLAQLVEREVLSADEAAVLAALFDRGVSIVVISLASGAGKSTLLDAIVQSGSQHRQRIYLRGGYETFDFLDFAQPGHSCLLVNEISPHLPIYLWGPGVGAFMHAAAEGYQLCATAHAADARSLIHLLTSPPLNVALSDVHQPKVVVSLDARGGGESAGHTVHTITAITPGTTAQATALSVIAEHGEAGMDVRLDRDALVSLLHDAGLGGAGFFEAADRFRESLTAPATGGGGANRANTP